MADIELTTVPTETSLADSDELYFNDVSETPDAVNRITWANAIGTALAALRSVFTAASASAAASLQFHEDTDNGTNKITVTAPAAIASDKTITLPDQTGTALVDSGGTLTGVWDAGGATSFEIPNDAAPTVNADGEIALDTTVTDFSHGIIKYYGGEELAIVALPVAELITPTDGHVVAYNATNDEFELVSAPGGGLGGSTGATDNAVLRANGTGGSTVQNSTVTISDNGGISTEMQTATEVGLNIKGAAAQSGNLLEVRNSSNTILTSVNSSGYIFSGNASADGRINSYYAGTLTAAVNSEAANGIAFALQNSYRLGWLSAIGGTGQNVALRRHADGVIAVESTSSTIRGFLGGGAAVASAAALPLPTGRVFHVTGTTSITSITSTGFENGAVITLIFDDALTFTDGNNLKLAGNFVTTADDTITLAYDGTNWYEVCRSVN